MHNELVKLQMQVELLKNYGRRSGRPTASAAFAAEDPIPVTSGPPQVSQSVESELRSGEAPPVLGNGHHLHPDSRKHAVSVRGADVCGKVVLNWKIGFDMSSALVTDTIRDALRQEQVTGGLALHSDQVSQCTSFKCFDLTKAYHV